MKQSILTLINNNLKKCLVILILISVLDVTALFIALGYSSAVCWSSMAAYLIAVYSISNVVGAKNGRSFNMHIIRWHYLKNHDKESTYQTSCLKYLSVLLPISAIWCIVNVSAATVMRFFR